VRTFATWWRAKAWRWQTGVALGTILLGISAVVGAWTNLLDETNEHANDEALRTQVEALQTELQCRVRASSDATRIEGEITREGWLALTIWARTGDSEQPRIAQAAERVEALYRELGPALERRAEAVERCD
jgi:hypothetical protein